VAGDVSTWARTRAVMKLTGGEGGDSDGLRGLDGSRPRRPFRLSVRTTDADTHTNSMFTRSTASNLEQAANLYCVF